MTVNVIKGMSSITEFIDTEFPDMMNKFQTTFRTRIREILYRNKDLLYGVILTNNPHHTGIEDLKVNRFVFVIFKVDEDDQVVEALEGWGIDFKNNFIQIGILPKDMKN